MQKPFNTSETDQGTAGLVTDLQMEMECLGAKVQHAGTATQVLQWNLSAHLGVLSSSMQQKMLLYENMVVLLTLIDMTGLKHKEQFIIEM